MAKYLQISKSTLNKLALGSKLPGQKVGKRWRLHKEVIDQRLKQHHDRAAVSLKLLIERNFEKN